MHPRRQRRSAFTLAEVLVAMAILCAAVVVVLSSVNQAIRMYRVARATVQATGIAQARLASLFPEGERPRERREQGPAQEGSRFSTEVVVEEVPVPGVDAPDVKGLYRATVAVRWDDVVGREVRLVRYVAASEGVSLR